MKALSSPDHGQHPRASCAIGQALFWTLAFPLIFVVLFGAIFSGGDNSTHGSPGSTRTGSPASAELRACIRRDRRTSSSSTRPSTTALEAMKNSDNVDAIIVVPKGYERGGRRRPPVGRPRSRPRSPTTSTQPADGGRDVQELVRRRDLAIVNQGRPAAIVGQPDHDPDRTAERRLLPRPEHPRDGPDAD